MGVVTQIFSGALCAPDVGTTLSQILNPPLPLRASHGIHMKAAHTVLYMKKYTQTYASYPAKTDGHQLYELGVDLEVYRGRALYRDASRAGRVRTGPASFK